MIYGKETVKSKTQRVSEARNFPKRKSFMESGARKRFSAVLFSNSAVIMDDASIVMTRSATTMMI